MSMKYIRDYYKVPAKRGARIEFEDDVYAFIYGFLADPKKQWRKGTIVGSSGQYLRVRFDGENIIKKVHPTWKLKYL